MKKTSRVKVVFVKFNNQREAMDAAATLEALGYEARSAVLPRFSDGKYYFGINFTYKHFACMQWGSRDLKAVKWSEISVQSLTSGQYKQTDLFNEEVEEARNRAVLDVLENIDAAVDQRKNWINQRQSQIDNLWAVRRELANIDKPSKADIDRLRQKVIMITSR